MKKFSVFVLCLILINVFFSSGYATEGSNSSATRIVASSGVAKDMMAFREQPPFPQNERRFRPGPRNRNQRIKLAATRTTIPKRSGIVPIHEPGIGINYPFMKQIMENISQDDPRLTRIPLEKLEKIYQQNCRVLNDLGVTWIRDIFVFRWDIIEPQQGYFDFSYPDFLIKTVHNAGIQILPIIRFFNHWDQGYSPRYLSLRESVDRKPKNMKAFQNFLSALVERYDGDGKDDMPGLKYPIRYYEIGNEPSFREYFEGSAKSYAEVLEAAYNTIKHKDPQARVLTAGLHSAIPKSKPMIKDVIDRKGTGFFDIISYHAYGDLAAIIENQDHFKGLLSRGENKKFWLTETATGISPLIGLEQQAGEVIKRFVLGFASGCDKVIWHLLYDNPGRSLTANCGLIERNMKKKPSYYTFKLMTSKLKDFTQVETLDLKKEIYAYKIVRPIGDLYIIWSREKTTFQMHLPPEFNRIIVTQGIAYSDIPEIYSIDLNQGVADLNLSPNPIYIESAP